MTWICYIGLPLIIGIFLQDDYLDCFGDPEFIGKVRCLHILFLLYRISAIVGPIATKALFSWTWSHQYLFLSQIGTDIEDYKCSWLVVQALERAAENQKSILFVSTIKLANLFHNINDKVRKSFMSVQTGKLRKVWSSVCCKGEGLVQRA